MYVSLPRNCSRCRAQFSKESMQCAGCGWDQEIARQRLWLLFRICAAVFVVAFFLAAAAIRLMPSRVAAAAVLGFAMVVIGGTEWLRWTERRSFVSGVSGVLNLESLRLLPTPRRVRLKTRAKLHEYLLVGAAATFLALDVLCAALYLRVVGHATVQTQIAVYSVVVLGFGGAAIFLAGLKSFNAKSKRLASSGQVAAARISRVRVGKGKTHLVSYEFEDQLGRLVSASSRDMTETLVPGMEVFVFFSQDDPQKDQIAECGSIYEVPHN